MVKACLQVLRRECLNVLVLKCGRCALFLFPSAFGAECYNIRDLRATVNAVFERRSHWGGRWRRRSRDPRGLHWSHRPFTVGLWPRRQRNFPYLGLRLTSTSNHNHYSDNHSSYEHSYDYEICVVGSPHGPDGFRSVHEYRPRWRISREVSFPSVKDLGHWEPNW